DLGTFLGKVAQPMLHFLQDALAPIQPIVAVLNLPVPVINDIAQEALDQDVTLLTVAKALKSVGALPPEWATVVTLADTLNKVNNLAKSFTVTSNSVILNAGDFDLSGNGDLRDKDLLGNLGDLGVKDLTDLAPYVTKAGESVIDRLNSSPLPQDAKDFFDGLI